LRKTVPLHHGFIRWGYSLQFLQDVPVEAKMTDITVNHLSSHQEEKERLLEG
jgi:hypothetical protein